MQDEKGFSALIYHGYVNAATTDIDGFFFLYTPVCITIHNPYSTNR